MVCKMLVFPARWRVPSYPVHCHLSEKLDTTVGGHFKSLENGGLSTITVDDRVGLRLYSSADTPGNIRTELGLDGSRTKAFLSRG